MGYGKTKSEVKTIPAPAPVFSDEQLDLFQERYDNGYDLCLDKDYVTWINLNHNGFLPSTSDDHDPYDLSKIDDPIIEEEDFIEQ